MAIKRMDNVLIVVDDLEAAKTFFTDLGLVLEGQSTVEGPLTGALVGLKDVKSTLRWMISTDLYRICAQGALRSSVRCSTKARIGLRTYAGQRASSLHLPSNWVDPRPKVTQHAAA
jgi:hypothetical protein